MMQIIDECIFYKSIRNFVYGEFFEKLIHKLKILCYNGFNKFYGIIFENFFKRNFESA